MIEDVEDDVYELPDSDFSKSSAIVIDKKDNEKYGVLPSSKFVELIETPAEESECLVGWSCKVSLMDLQRGIFLEIHALKRERYQERIYLKEG